MGFHLNETLLTAVSYGIVSCLYRATEVGQRIWLFLSVGSNN